MAATVMGIANVNVVANNGKEEINMTKADLRNALEEKGIAMSNAEFKATKKADLEAKLAAVVAPVAEVAKAWRDMTPAEKLEDAKLSKWDSISMLLAAEFTMQSKYRKYANAAAGKDMGEIWRLFYKNTKGKVVKDDYLVKTKRLFAATSRVIEVFGKDKIKKEDITSDLIQQALNAMFVRGFLNFKKVNGNKNDENIAFSASRDQMNAMFKFAAPVYAANKDNDLLK